MKFYLAARYSRAAEMVGYARELEAMGHVVTSRWINGNHKIPHRGLDAEHNTELREKFAVEDWQDLIASNAVISFTEYGHGHTTGRGGRHFEFGAAYAYGKLCITVGPRENIFHCLPRVKVYPNWETMRAIAYGVAKQEGLLPANYNTRQGLGIESDSPESLPQTHPPC